MITVQMQEELLDTGKLRLQEAVLVPGSASLKGGEVGFLPSYFSPRYINPLRIGASVQTYANSDVQWVAKIGDSLVTTGTTGPWGADTVANNVGNIDTAWWGLPMQTIDTYFPVREWVLRDINALSSAIENDLVQEFSTIEAQSCATNDDTSTTNTPTTGAQAGLRGLASYPGGTVAAWGSSGFGNTGQFGRHTIATWIQASPTALAYSDVLNVSQLLGGQFLNMPDTVWQATPAKYFELRNLRDNNQLPLIIDTGEHRYGSAVCLFGFPVVINPFLNAKYPLYLINMSNAVEFVDHGVMEIEQYEQFLPGSVTYFARKRVCFSVKSPFALTRLQVGS